MPPDEAMWNETDLLNDISQLIGRWTLRGCDCRDLYIALRAMTLTMEPLIERVKGPFELATAQRLAFEVSASIRPVIVPGAAR